MEGNLATGLVASDTAGIDKNNTQLHPKHSISSKEQSNSRHVRTRDVFYSPQQITQFPLNVKTKYRVLPACYQAPESRCGSWELAGSCVGCPIDGLRGLGAAPPQTADGYSPMTVYNTTAESL